jgi:hypothetical protein
MPYLRLGRGSGQALGQRQRGPQGSARPSPMSHGKRASSWPSGHPEANSHSIRDGVWRINPGGDPGDPVVLSTQASAVNEQSTCALSCHCRMPWSGNCFGHDLRFAVAAQSGATSPATSVAAARSACVEPIVRIAVVDPDDQITLTIRPRAETVLRRNGFILQRW